MKPVKIERGGATTDGVLVGDEVRLIGGRRAGSAGASAFTLGGEGIDELGHLLGASTESVRLADMALTADVDGEQRRSSRADGMILSIAPLIAYCSTLTRLRPGDTIAAKTPGSVGSRMRLLIRSSRARRSRSRSRASVGSATRSSTSRPNRVLEGERA